MRNQKVSNGMGNFVRRIERLERLYKSSRKRNKKLHNKLVQAAYQYKYYTRHRNKVTRGNLVSALALCRHLSKKFEYLKLNSRRNLLVTLTLKQKKKLMEAIKHVRYKYR